MNPTSADAVSGSHRRVLVAAAALFLGLLLVWLALEPGRTGGWIFDDFANLGDLAKLNHDPGWYNTLQYLANGVSGPTHRPLSLLTFALQRDSWDQSPADFADVNILLHLLNATLVFWLLVRLERLRGRERYGLPLLAALLWALAPVQPSAVLYIVQRMAVLAGTCVFAGTLLHLCGREALRNGRSLAGYLLVSGGVAVGLGLGALAKESAIVYPLLVLSLEATVLAEVPGPPRWRLWCRAFLVLPMAVFGAYLVAHLPQTLEDYASRDFTLADRLLSECRILWMYLGKLVVPSLANARLLYDDVQVSRSLLDPWTTLPALLAWLGVVVLAVRRRRAWPLFSLAVLWFLSAHALESTFLPLELMFDHRNYFAIAMPIWAALEGASALLEAPSARRLRPVLMLFAVCYVAAFFVGTRSSAELWGRPVERARFWALRQPDSSRAYHELAETLLAARDWRGAAGVYDAAARRWPDDPLILLSQLELACYDAGLTVPSLPTAAQAILRTHREPLSVISMIRRLAARVATNRCPHYSLGDMHTLIQVGLLAPGLSRHQVYLFYDYAGVTEQLGDLPVALDYVDKAIARWPDMELFKKAVSLSLELGDLPRARHYVDEAESSPAISPLHRWSYRREIAAMREVVDSLGANPPQAAPR